MINTNWTADVYIEQLPLPYHFRAIFSGEFCKGGSATIDLKNLPAEIIDNLCNDYRARLFEKCGKVDPRANP